MAFCLFLGFSALIFQFFKLQVAEGNEWEEKGRKQHYFSVVEPFKRGRFFSQPLRFWEKEEPFAIDIKKYHLFCDPALLTPLSKNGVAEALTGLLQLSKEDQDALKLSLSKKSRSKKLLSYLSPGEKGQIESWWKEYAKDRQLFRGALFFVRDWRRVYPHGHLLGQVLHTIQELKDDKTQQAAPTGGAELMFNKYVKGKLGKRRMLRSPRRSFDLGAVQEPAQDGADVYLTINPVLQGICEQEIESGVKKCGAKAGWSVMLDPFTGEVLALAQYPFFYPERYREYFNDKEKIENTKIKAITDAHEPASVMKGLTVALALLANEELEKRGAPPFFSPEEAISTAEGVFPGRRRPIKDTRLHKYLNMDMGIQKSSNIYAGKLVQAMIEKMGEKWYRARLEEVFGIGKRTGIELPAESPGNLPTPGKLHPNGKLEWSKPTPYSLAMGHNVMANSLQILSAYATIANGGYRISPTIVKKIAFSDFEGKKEVLWDNSYANRTRTFKKVLSKKITDRVTQSLKYVTKPGGGGYRGDVIGYSEAGKTGTSKKIVRGAYSSEKYVANFVGFTPAESPAFVLMVVMDEPDISFHSGQGFMYYGAQAAAPVFSKIAKRALEYLQVPPDDPLSLIPESKRAGKLPDWQKKAKQLQEMYDKWNIPK